MLKPDSHKEPNRDGYLQGVPGPPVVNTDKKWMSDGRPQEKPVVRGSMRTEPVVNRGDLNPKQKTPFVRGPVR